jgi:hypothetical protein
VRVGSSDAGTHRILPRPPCRKGRRALLPCSRPHEPLSWACAFRAAAAAAARSVACVADGASRHMRTCSREWWRRQRGGARAFRGWRGLRGLRAALRSQPRRYIHMSVSAPHWLLRLWQVEFISARRLSSCAAASGSCASVRTRVSCAVQYAVCAVQYALCKAVHVAVRAHGRRISLSVTA